MDNRRAGLLPDNGDRYEIIDGELFVTKAPHWKHQKVIGWVFSVLNHGSEQNQSGQAIPTPGVIFTDADNVIPDVVWVSKERLPALIDDAGHLTGDTLLNKHPDRTQNILI